MCTLVVRYAPSTGSVERARGTGPWSTISLVGSEIYLRRRLLAAGYGDHEVRRMLRDGTLRAIRRGAYVGFGDEDDDAARHALLVRAALAELSLAVVVSHVSAAVLHGLCVWGVALDGPRCGASRAGPAYRQRAGRWNSPTVVAAASGSPAAGW